MTVSTSVLTATHCSLSNRNQALQCMQWIDLRAWCWFFRPLKSKEHLLNWPTFTQTQVNSTQYNYLHPNCIADLHWKVNQTTLNFILLSLASCAPLLWKWSSWDQTDVHVQVRTFLPLDKQQSMFNIWVSVSTDFSKTDSTTERSYTHTRKNWPRKWMIIGSKSITPLTSQNIPVSMFVMLVS